MKNAWFFILGSLFTLSLPLLYFCGPGGSGTVGSIKLDDGSLFKVVQKYTYNATEPYEIGFYMKLDGKPWGWCYIDHEALRWRQAQLIHDETQQSIKVYKGDQLRGEYFMEKETFALYKKHTRELDAPQSLRDPPY